MCSVISAVVPHSKPPSSPSFFRLFTSLCAIYVAEQEALNRSPDSSRVVAAVSDAICTPAPRRYPHQQAGYLLESKASLTTIAFLATFYSSSRRPLVRYPPPHSQSAGGIRGPLFTLLFRLSSDAAESRGLSNGCLQPLVGLLENGQPGVLMRRGVNKDRRTRFGFTVFGRGCQSLVATGSAKAMGPCHAESCWLLRFISKSTAISGGPCGARALFASPRRHPTQLNCFVSLPRAFAPHCTRSARQGRTPNASSRPGLSFVALLAS